MRKYFWLMLIALLTVAFSATAYAVDLKASGMFRVDSDLFRNVAAPKKGIYGPIDSDFRPGGGAFDRDAAYMSSRARLKFDMVADKNLSGTVYLEMDSSTWGDKSGDRNRMGFWTADRAAVEVKNAYINFGLPYFGIPVPMTVRAGIQGLSLRSGLFYSADGAGVTLGMKPDPMNIQLYWFKPYEGNTATADDADIYAMHASVKIDKMTIGGWGAFLNMNAYPIPTAVPAYGTDAAANRADMYWLGAYGEGKLGPANFKLDFAYDTGTVESKANAAAHDVDYTGWAVHLKVDVPVDKYNFGVVTWYATGSDQKKTSGDGLPGDATPWGTTTKKVNSYVLPVGTEIGGMCGEGFVFFDNWALGIEHYGSSSTALGNGNMNRGHIGGTWMAKLYGVAQLAPWYNITLQAMYIGDTTKNGNTVGNARKPGTTRPRDDASIGWELGLLNEFKIYKQLTWYAGGGYLFAGDALDYYDGTKFKNVSPKDPWQIATRLLYEF